MRNSPSGKHTTLRTWTLHLRTVLLLLSGILAVVAHAQQYSFSVYGNAEGLTNQMVYGVAEDTHGVLWAGSDNGVYRADGGRFERVQAFDALELGPILRLGNDRAGRLWFLGSKLLVYMQDGVLHTPAGLTFDLVNQRSAELLFPSEGSEDRILVRVNGELEEILSRDGGRNWERRPLLAHAQLLQHPELKALSALAPDDKETWRGGVGPEATGFWSGCGNALCHVVVRSHGEAPEIETWGTRRGVPAAQWLSIIRAHDGQIWARSSRDVIRLNPFTGEVRSFPGDNRTHDAVYGSVSIIEDPQGRILVNLYNGLGRLENGHWRILDTFNGIPDFPAESMMFDRKGELWLTSWGHGVAHWIGYGNWEAWTTKQKLSSNMVWSVVRDHQHRLWLATSSDLDQLVEPVNGAQPHSEPQHSGLTLRDATALAVDSRGHLWITGNDGRVIDYDVDRNKPRVLQQNVGHAYTIVCDHQQRVWVASITGVNYLSPEDGWSHFHPASTQGGPAANAYVMAQGADHTLWVSSREGLYWLEHADPSVPWRHSAFPLGVQRAMYPVLQPAPDGTLWMQGTGAHPLVRLKAEGSHLRVIEEVDQSLIHSAGIAFLAYDRRGWLWVGTDLGVFVSNGRHWIHLNQEDGLIWDDTDSSGFLADTDGSVWIGTSGGLSHFLNPERIFEANAPEALVPSIEVGGAALQPGISTVLDLRHPTLSATFFNSDYDRPSAIHFAYQLEGLDAEWQEPPDHRVRYPSLAPGNYRLRVVAVDKRRNLPSRAIEFPFEIQAPWWQRTWCRVLEFTLAALLVLLLWRASVKLLVARQRELESLVKARTQELERDKAELLEARATLLEMNRRDPLTGLLNRAAIFEQLRRERERAVQEGGLLAVIMADLDSFKSINDTYGHLFGDAVIRECARRMQETLRPGDSVGRYGGEELLLLLPGLRAESAEARMEELRQAIASAPVTDVGKSRYVTCSFGLAWLTTDPGGDAAREMETAIANADAALYVAKQNGRNRVEIAALLAS